ncbi:PEGA domain-containing protein [Anatilimnocola sp. NA78]|uniref:PEGA domain-containing protein n=1 Tax=Anatilimnocola sp. NA78 TaxID=3415683 RepID=UPI003CE52164
MRGSRSPHLDTRSLRTCCVALVLLCVLNTGCVRRRMTIRSFPAGAQVFVDDQEIGTTPCSSAFVYYGTRKIMLVKDGYKTETLYHQFTVPWHQYVPLDFINENLNPREIRDERIVDVTLAPQETVSPEKLLERANNLRSGARLGMITPLPTVPPGTVLPKMGVPGDGLPGNQPIPYQSLPTPTGQPAVGGGNTPLGPPASTLGPQNLSPQNLGPQNLSPQQFNPPLPTFGQQQPINGALPPGQPLPSGAVPPRGAMPPTGAVPPAGSPPQFFPSQAFQ